MRITNVIDVIYQHERVKLLETFEFFSYLLIPSQIKAYELVDERKVQLEVVNCYEWKLFLLLKILPVKVDQICYHGVKNLLYEIALDGLHVVDSLLYILHQPLDIFCMFLVLELVILGVIGGHHQLHFKLDQFSYPSPQLNDKLSKFLAICRLCGPWIVVFTFQFVWVMLVNLLTIKQVNLSLGYLQRVVLYYQLSTVQCYYSLKDLAELLVEQWFVAIRLPD